MVAGGDGRGGGVRWCGRLWWEVVAGGGGGRWLEVVGGDGERWWWEVVGGGGAQWALM